MILFDDVMEPTDICVNEK